MPRKYSVFPVILVSLGIVSCGDGGLDSAPVEQAEADGLAATTTVFIAVADAHVEKSNPNTNHGSATSLAVDGSPLVRSYLRFDVSNLQGNVQSAKLKAYATSGTVDGPKSYKTSNAWSESTITWNTAPAPEGVATADKGSISGGWVAFNVTPIVTDNGTYSFVLDATSSDAVDFHSREGAERKPQLVITTDSSTDSSICGNGTCDAAETCSSCGEDCGTCNGSSPHAYFDALVARPDHWRSYSLRDQAQLATYSQHGPNGEQDINYVWPNDQDPRKQDAAKLVIPSDGSGIKSPTNRNSIYQVRVPMGPMDLGHSYLVVWDAWYGDEFRYPISGLTAHKAFQFDGPDIPNGSAKIWWEPHHSYKGNSVYPVDVTTEVGASNVRHYASSWKWYETSGTWRGVPVGPNVTSGSTSVTPTTPYTQFNIKPEKWVRYWQLIEYGMDSMTIADYNGGPLESVPNPPKGTLMSLWAVDEDGQQVQLYERLQVTLWPPGIRKFWIEMNTSTNEVKVGRPDLIAYFRNIVVLKDVSYANVPSLLQPPVQ